MTDREILARLLAAGFSTGELAVYRRFWTTGKGYEANREVIDAINDYRTREDF